MRNKLFQELDSMCFSERIIKMEGKEKELLKELRQIKTLQACKRFVKLDVLHSKYKLKNLYMSYCYTGMIRKALDVND